MAGQTDSYVRNSQHLVKEISKITLAPDGLLVSFDVSSLFTNVPVDDAVSVIGEMLNDPELSIRTFFNADSVPSLLSLCL